LRTLCADDKRHAGFSRSAGAARRGAQPHGELAATAQATQLDHGLLIPTSEVSMSHSTKLPVQQTETINGRGEPSIRRTVRCPKSDHTVPEERCQVCGWSEGTGASGPGERTIDDTIDHPIEDSIACRHPEMRVSLAQPSIADRVGVEEIMTRRVLSATSDVSVEALTSMLIDNHIGCVPIVDANQRPVGMVTKHDLVQFQFTRDGNQEWVVAKRRKDDDAEPGLHRFEVVAAVAEEVMLPLAITLSERATVAHAAALMAIEGIHHVPVVDLHGKLIGIVSSMDIARWLARNDGYLPADGPRA
jgi:CBS domain-containing protein